MKPHAKIWRDPPKLALPNNPAIVTDCDNAWVAYEMAHCDERTFAVVRFASVIDFHLSPINDEGLREHRYATAGLKFYAFHELFDTDETRRWSRTGGRQFVITFKDVTIDVIARDPSVVAEGIIASDTDTALQLAIKHARQTVG